MRQEIEALFKEELDLIKDQDLREKTIAAWEMALKESGFGVRDLQETLPFTLLNRSKKCSLAEHVKVVTRIAYDGAKRLNEMLGLDLNMDFVVAGGLLHDVGKVLEYAVVDGQVVKSKKGRLLRHPISGAQIARDAGLPDEIQHMIAVHSREGDGGYRSAEAYVVHHADFMSFDVME